MNTITIARVQSDVMRCTHLGCVLRVSFAIDGVPYCLDHMLRRAKYEPWQVSQAILKASDQLFIEQH
jgi:hypothetical protein